MAITVCWGAGWDSTAMLIEMHRRGIRPDMITFADVGAEKQGTYDFIPLFVQWCKDVDFPEPTICMYQPKDATHERYKAAAQAAADRRGVVLSEVRLNRLARIFGNMVANETLPGLAFGMKSCSIKWKVEAQEPPRCKSDALMQAWHNGERVQKLIGFDATEDHRTFADGSGLNIGGGPGIPKYGDRYIVDYPLRKWGINRAECGRIIVDAGFDLPPKSACFFCPAMKLIEIAQLRITDPDLFELAMEMELLFRAGRHFRGDGIWSVKAKHKTTGELWSCDLSATSPAHAKLQARATLKDVRPYKWAMTASPSVPGLGRSFSWTSLPIAQ